MFIYLMKRNGMSKSFFFRVDEVFTNDFLGNLSRGFILRQNFWREKINCQFIVAAYRHRWGVLFVFPSSSYQSRLFFSDKQQRKKTFLGHHRARRKQHPKSKETFSRSQTFYFFVPFLISFSRQRQFFSVAVGTKKSSEIIFLFIHSHMIVTCC